MRCFLAIILMCGAATGCNVHVSVLEAGNGLTCDLAANPVDTSHPDVVVGDGSAASCTEDALNLALETGGVIRFRCGANPSTIPVTAEKVIARDTVIDGGNTITLDGGGKSRLFVVGAPGGRAVSLTLQYLTLQGGIAAITPASAGGSARAGGGAVLQFGGSLVITDSVLRGNDASAAGDEATGGAVCSLGGRLVIARTLLDGNRAGSGGAVAALASEIVLSRSQLTNNQAVGQGSITAGIGGALLADQQGQSVGMCQVTLSSNRALGFGTALHLQGIAGEPVTIEQAAILDNVSPETNRRAAPAVFLGILDSRLSAVTVARNLSSATPGVWVNGGTQAAQAATIHFTNVTVASNNVHRQSDATEDGVGAALWIEGIVHGEIVNCTLADNLSEFGSGIVHPQQLVVRNTIIANRGTNVPWTPQNCSDLADALTPASGDRVLQWPVESLDRYLCVSGATLADPLLGSLQDNGGGLPTLMPAASSPAVGAGADCPATDARGHVRPAACTLGAVEADGASPCPTCSLTDAAADSGI